MPMALEWHPHGFGMACQCHRGCIGVPSGFHWGSIGVALGLHRGCIGVQSQFNLPQVLPRSPHYPSTVPLRVPTWLSDG
ncbi:MAG: hypothetical protein C75L2_00620008 [Leptospirillum sp. Group II 'C75']|nr:MAG: hypothetical protein C75L2_00620008 [Leptospirillum sp. Group II 'C75']